MTRLSRNVRLTLAVIREQGGTVCMRRLAGHESPWLYVAGNALVSRRHVRALEDAGVLTRIEPGIAGCERCRFEIVEGAA